MANLNIIFKLDDKINSIHNSILLFCSFYLKFIFM